MAFPKSVSIDLQSWLIFLCFLLSIVCGAVDGRICSEIDVRNDPDQLQKLRGCTTVVGSVQIVLIEKFGKGFDAYQFPELREITGYLLFFRVFGLKTLNDLFPNLTVIRGERLKSHYALILYEMTDLTEIGLVSLIKIHRGYVMIRYCPMLCYVNTINWEAITQVPIGGGLGNYLDYYDSSSACPTKKSCPDTCYQNNCWNNQKCQLFDTNKSNTNPNLTCHKECMGGCRNERADGCHVCRNYFSLDDRTCVRECPKDQYILSSLCVNATYCINKKKKPILGECRNSCPLIISEKFVNISSVDQCARECPATEVDSLATSDLLRGCQIVKGDINIRLQSGVTNTMQILERNLGDIEEIEGILKVYRSPVITSLSFFRSLRIIQGNTSEKSKYTFIIMSNENLQELWDFNEKRSLILGRGNLQVHYNSKLCLKQIYELQQILKTNTSEDFISLTSNGYEQTCSARAIITTNTVLNQSSVRIVWKRIDISDSEKVMGYIVHYIIAPERTVKYLGIDSCVEYGWQTVFIPNFMTNVTSTSHSVVLGNLTQNTQYAYYVKTQVAPKEHEEKWFSIGQGQSNIEYFTTEPDQPNFPYVETIAKTNVSLTLAWGPTMDNELIEYYKMDMFIQPDDHEFLDSRNYCLDKRVDVHVNVGVEQVTENPAAMFESCNAEFENWKINHPDAVDPEFEWRMHRQSVCDERASRLTQEQRQLQIMKYVQNHKIRNCGGGTGSSSSSSGSGSKCAEKNDFDSARFSRQIHSMLSPIDNIGDYDLQSSGLNLGVNHIDSRIFTNRKLNETFPKLRPFTLYIFQFFACNYVNCSSYFLHYERTDADIYADTISLTVSIDPYYLNRVHLNFSEPPHPNGLTVAFEIEKHNLNNFNVTTVCITRKQHYENGKRYTFDHLDKGQYSFRVRSLSLAMTGAYTEYTFINIYNQSNVSTMGILGTVFLCLLILISIVVAAYFYRKRRIRMRMRSLNASTQNIMAGMDEVALEPSIEEELPPFYHARGNNEFF